MGTSSRKHEGTEGATAKAIIVHTFLRYGRRSIGTHLEELEEREWLKKKLGYGAL